MKKELIFLSLTLFTFGCGINKHKVLPKENRKGQPFDIRQDTFVNSHFRHNGKLGYEEYKLNNKRLFVKQYRYYKDGGWEVIQGKTFFKKDGFAYSYHANGQLKIVSQFQEGKENGKRLTYYSNGNAHCICNYSNGKRAGQHTIYWDNGQLFSKEEYQNGMLWNIFERFHKDGQKMDFGKLKDGNGIVKIYNEDNSFNRFEYYKNGVKTSK